MSSIRFDVAIVIVMLGTISATASAGPVFLPPVDYPVGPDPSGLAIGDIDGDGDLDIVTAIPSTNCVAVLTNDGAGVFGGLVWIPISSQATSVYLADVNGDGRLDLIAPERFGRSVSVRWNNGDGTWSADLVYPISTWTNAITSIECGDVDGDGDVDMIVAKNGSFALGGTPGSNTGVYVLHNNGFGWFGDAPGDLYFNGTNPTDVRLADLDGDTVQELVVAFRAIGSVVPGNLAAFRSLGAAGFETVGSPIGNHASADLVRIGDIDGDGVPDVCAVQQLSRPRMMRNTGGLTFAADVTIPTIGVIRSYGFELSDIDLDGDLDCVIADGSNIVSKPSRIATLLNDGSGLFPPPRMSPVSPPVPGESVTLLSRPAVGDVNGDGYPDVVVTLPDNGTVCVLMNKGPQPPSDLCFADITGDGKVDVEDFTVFATRFGEPVYPYFYGDFNGDGVVNGTDFPVLAGAFGTVCP